MISAEDNPDIDSYVINYVILSFLYRNEIYYITLFMMTNSSTTSLIHRNMFEISVRIFVNHRIGAAAVVKLFSLGNNLS